MIEHFLAAFSESFSLHHELGSSPFSRSYLVTERQSGADRYLGILAPGVSPGPSSITGFLESMKQSSGASSVFLQIDQGGLLDQESFYYLTPELPRDVVPLQGQSFSPHRVSQIGAVCCHALAALHDLGRVHGAITPACLVVSEAGVQVGDAGILSVLHRFGIQTGDFQSLETRYTSPEQILSGTADPRSDVYSLGATLYCLLTGKPPYGGRATAALMATVLIDEDVADALTGGQEPGHVAAAILRAIEKAPFDRWSSAQQFGDALLRASPGSGSPLHAARDARRPGCLPGLALFPSVYALYRLLNE